MFGRSKFKEEGQARPYLASSPSESPWGRPYTVAYTASVISPCVRPAGSTAALWRAGRIDGGPHLPSPPLLRLPLTAAPPPSRWPARPPPFPSRRRWRRPGWRRGQPERTRVQRAGSTAALRAAGWTAALLFTVLSVPARQCLLGAAAASDNKFSCTCRTICCCA